MSAPQKSTRKTKKVKKDAFQGHPGHLNEQQQAALDEFKQKLEAASLYTPTGDNHDASHSDATLLRFLRARKYNTEQAEELFSASAAWRAKLGVDKLYSNFDTDEFEAAREYYPKWTGRCDKNGLAIYVYKLAAVDAEAQKELNAVPEQRRYERVVVLYETMLRVVCPLVSSVPSAVHPMPISSTFTLIDLEDVSLKTMWNLRGFLQQASTISNANYPETLHRVYVVNAPSFFPTVWGWIKSWFDPYTRSKIQILGKATAPETQKKLFAEIDPDNLPRAYGGNFDWVFEDAPKLSDVLKDKLREAGEEGGEFPRGPCNFIVGRDGKPRLTRKGSSGGSNSDHTAVEEDQASLDAHGHDAGKAQPTAAVEGAPQVA